LILPAALWLSGCASDPQVRVVTETRTVEKTVEVVKPVPAGLTAPLLYPPPLPASFTVEDVIDLTFELYDLIDKANADRASVRDLTPEPNEPAEEPVQ
jgi:hypothetical protein